MAKEKANCNIFGDPVTEGNRHSTISKCFDFIIVKYLPELNSYNFTSYDISVNDSEYLIDKKFTNAKKLIA
jgi:hypothetical protein